MRPEDAVDALRADTCGRLVPGRAGDLLVVRGDAVVDLGALLEVEAVFREGRQVAGASSRPRPHRSPPGPTAVPARPLPG